MGITAAAWCVACGELPLVAISYERKGIMAHYGACRQHVLQVAERALHDLDGIDVQKVAGYIDVSHEAIESRPVRDVTWHGNTASESNGVRSNRSPRELPDGR